MIVFFAYFFILLKAQKGLLRSHDYNIVSFTLLFTIFVNMMFNEVALSPNTCASYFLTVGCLCLDTINTNKYRRKEARHERFI